MIDLKDVSSLRDFFQLVHNNDEYVHIRFHGLEKICVEGKVFRVGDDFVEIKYRYAQYVCPYHAIRLVTLK